MLSTAHSHHAQPNQEHFRMDIQTTDSAALAPTVPGTPFQGGFYVGRFRIGADEFALIVSPKAAGEASKRSAWGPYGQSIEGSRSFSDGAANTAAMATAGSTLAAWAQALQINEHSDWYLPARDELELLYRHLKPTAETNYGYRSGENPSSLPQASYPYTDDAPAQTSAAAFQDGGDEAMEDAWYWSSTQSSARNAWGQGFDDGNQIGDGKSYEGRARAVRRFKLNP